MNTKRLTALLISVLMILQMFAMSAAATYIEQADKPADIQFTVPWAVSAWTPDGVIDVENGEYTKLDIKQSQLSYATASEELAAAAQEKDVTLYMSYSKNYVYIAAETPADQYVCDIDDSNAGNMWAAHAIQLSLADINATDSADRLEVGYALSSLDNEQYACSWFDPMGIAYDPDNNGDYIVVRDGNKLIYEMRVPFEAFVEETLTEGDSFLGSVVWAVGTSEDGGSDAYAHIQLGYGLSGDPGKDPTGHATFTLGEIPEGVEPEETVPDIISIPYVDAETVSVDGEKDSAYENGAVAVINKPGVGIPAATATASMLTNNGLLYLYVEVTDPRVVIPTPELQASEPWYADSVEFLFQTHNDVFHDVHQFRVDVTDYLSYYRNADGDIQAYGTDAEDYFCSHAAVQTETGYIVEFCIDTKKFGVSAGETIGIQMQLNDADTVNGWTCSSYCQTDNSFNTEYFDTVLIGEGEEYTTTREIPASGVCGDNLTWELNDDGVLTISGTGEMYWDPFGDIKSAIKSVIIENGVTSISGYAFSECPALTSVTIGDDVAVIGECAFRESSNLESITIPESVTAIEILAFYRCTSLEYVIFENCDPLFGDWVFEDCTSLRYADLGNALTTLGVGMFFNCSSLTDVYFRGIAPAMIAEEAFTGTQVDSRLCLIGDGAEGWSFPVWDGPDGCKYTILGFADDVQIPIELPNIDETTMVDSNLIGIENVDGIKDEIYNDASVAMCDKLMPGNEDSGASAKASMVGHSGLLFLYIEVEDADIQMPDPDVQEGEPWNVDSVEFLLWTHNKIFDDIHQFRLDVTGYPSYYSINNLKDGEITSINGDEAAKYFEAYEVVQTESGYVIEACIDVKKYGISYSENVGIQMQLNDVTENTITRYSYTYSVENGSFATEYYDNTVIGGWLYSMTREYDRPEDAYRGVVAKTDSDAITVDGYLDEAAWADALQVPIGEKILGHIGDGDTGTRGFAYMLWADGKWYLYVNVNDDHVETPIPWNQENEPWRTDSVEMFFDFGGKHEHIVEQFRLDCAGYPSYYLEGGTFSAYGDEAAPYFDDYAVTIDDEGYNIEMCLNLGGDYQLEEGYEIGIQLQVNDMWSEIHPDDTAAVYVMGSALEARSWDVLYYDYITLGGQIESQIPDTTDYDGYLNASAETLKPGDSFTVDFYIPEEKTLETSGFALTNFVYNSKCFAIDTDHIEILADPLIRDITKTGNIVMAFDGAESLTGSIIRIPVTVLDTAGGGTFDIGCTAQYQAFKMTKRLVTKAATVVIDSDTIVKSDESYRGEVVKVDSSEITIDGKMDEAAWADAMQILIDQKLTGIASGEDTGARAFAYTLWADNKWYLYVNVYDKDVVEPNPQLQETEPWRTDSVEMFFDFGNEHKQLVSQFRLDSSGYASYYVEGDTFHAYGEEAKPYFGEYKVEIDEEGYNIEMCMNMAPYGLEEGSEIGIQLQLNDMVESYSPDDLCAIFVMDSAMDAGSWDVEKYDYIKLGGIADHTANAIEGGALVSSLEDGETLRAGDTFTLDFVISREVFETTGFALANFNYDVNVFTMLADQIIVNSEVNALTADISDTGNIMLAFDGMTQLNDVIVSIPFVVNEDALGGEFAFSCTAQYQGNQATCNMQVTAAVVSVEADELRGDLNGDGAVTTEDAVLLTWRIFLPDDYPVAPQSLDFNGDGPITTADAVYLLWHVFSPKEYPFY